MKKIKLAELPINRLEAFSDGVIAIIITIMVFDLKLPEFPKDASTAVVLAELGKLVPRLTAYTFSYLVLGILWVNHSHLTHRVHKSNGVFLWHNLHLLFWMSLIPFATNFIGARSEFPLAVAGYGLVMVCNSLAFTMMRHYANCNLLGDTLSEKQKRQINRKNYFSVGIYAATIPFAFVSIYIAYLLLVLVPMMYFLPTQTMEE